MQVLHKVLLLAVLAAAALLPASTPVRAQDESFGASYITPFPAGDVYQALVIGDSLAEGILEGLLESFGGDVRLQIQRRHKNFPSLMRIDFDDQVRALEEQFQRENWNIAVVLLGTEDRISVRLGSGKRAPVGSEEWRAEFGRRVDRLMKMMKRRNIAVYWVSMPNMRRYEANEDAQVMNEIMRERAYLNGLKYVDVYQGFTDETGGYSPYGPDVAGKITLLRERNGVHFTAAGNRKLAHFVERELRRDLTQARNDRTIPLAGTEAEQARIRPEKTEQAPPAAAAAAQAAAAAPADKERKPTVVPGAAPEEVGGEQKADNSKISLKATTQSGAEEVVTVDILRPPIAASVVALVTRKESSTRPSQMGDTVLDRIAGGLTVMSSITPAVSSGLGRRPSSPTQTPYFRVLIKGERITPKTGRADDMTWPRPEPPPEVEAVPAPESAAPQPRVRKAVKPPG